jgi:ATP adenylyltransferase
MLEQIFIEFSGRVFHAPRWDKSASGSCPICSALSDSNQHLGTVTDVLHVLKNVYPYAPGHLLLVPNHHVPDLARVDHDYGSAVFSALREASERLGRGYWIFSNTGWVAGQSLGHAVFHVLPDPWSIDASFAEEISRRPTFDPFTDVLIDGVRGRKFAVRYGDGHMTGILVHNFAEFARVVGAMRAKLGRMRDVLYPARQAMLERGHVPHVGYHLLVLNYSEPHFVVIPRVFVPKEGRWGALELLYNADLRRDLDGDDAERFWAVAEEKNAEIARTLLK